jgi:hypothetical protein
VAKKAVGDVSIGKFDILATYAYARARHEGLSDDEARERGMVAAIMGARARLGYARSAGEGDSGKQKDTAERKAKTTITPRLFEDRVARKMGTFFDEVFLPSMKDFVEAGLSYDEVKRAVRIPATWGAKIGGREFERRARAFSARHRHGPVRKR